MFYLKQYRHALTIAGLVLLFDLSSCHPSQLAASSNEVVLGRPDTAVADEQQAQPQEIKPTHGDSKKAPSIFCKDFTRPMSIPDEGIEAAVEVLRSGRLFRYSSSSAAVSQVALAEVEFAKATGARFAIGVNSCSSAILVALLCVGVQPGDKVLMNSFTFTAVASTILRLGAEPVLVECCDRCDRRRSSSPVAATAMILCTAVIIAA